MKSSNLKYFFLGGFIATLGIWGLAVNIPNSFKAGDVVSASKINENFSSLKTSVDALEGFAQKELKQFVDRDTLLFQLGTTADGLHTDLIERTKDYSFAGKEVIMAWIVPSQDIYRAPLMDKLEATVVNKETVRVTYQRGNTSPEQGSKILRANLYVLYWD